MLGILTRYSRPELGGDEWMDNNKDRGYKLIQMYRTDCGAETKIQLTIRR